MDKAGRLRIGELSRRVGISPELLRAWENRYALVQPARSPGGLRLYSVEDEQRVRRMQERIAAGLSASEAARLAKLGDALATAEPGSLSEIERSLERSFEALDEPAAQAALDRLFGAFPLRPALAEVILPFLHRLGEQWAAAETSVAQEHFASSVIGGRLRALGRGWGQGVGPRAVLACPPGEQHELGLLCFGLALRERGWRITYLGAETPLIDISEALGELSPVIVVLTAVTPQRFLGSADEIRDLAARARVALGGAGASQALAGTLGAESLEGDAVSAASSLAP
jgi:MerR family transcriptional regulator, light-induced transcriptional regulator